MLVTFVRPSRVRLDGYTPRIVAVLCTQLTPVKDDDGLTVLLDGISEVFLHPDDHVPTDPAASTRMGKIPFRYMWSGRISILSQDILSIAIGT